MLSGSPFQFLHQVLKASPGMEVGKVIVNYYFYRNHEKNLYSIRMP